MWLATWDGIAEPREAVTHWETSRARRGQKPLTAGGQRAAIEGGQKVSTTRSQKRPKRVATKRPTAADTEAAVLAALARNPGLTNAELAAEVGTSERTARRYRRPLETVATSTATEVATS